MQLYIAAEPPTNLAVSQTKPNSLTVSWTPPKELVDITGYRLYYDCHGGSVGSVDVAGGSHTTQVVSGLIDGVSCAVSLAALSVHLPSRLVRYREMVPISKPLYTYQILLCCNAYTFPVRVPVISVLRIESTVVEIKWSATIGVEQYEVSYERLTGQKQSGHCPKLSQSARLQYSAGITQALLSGLEEYSNYHITVNASRGQGSFVASETVNIMTGSAGTHFVQHCTFMSNTTSVSLLQHVCPIGSYIIIL